MYLSVDKRMGTGVVKLQQPELVSHQTCRIPAAEVVIRWHELRESDRDDAEKTLTEWRWKQPSHMTASLKQGGTAFTDRSTHREVGSSVTTGWLRITHESGRPS
jgi:hypothetical protein